MARWGVIAALLLASGCIDYLEPGEVGPLRYFGDVRGAMPLRLLPPTSDREGNVYVLYGDPDLNEVRAFVGHADGGWTDACDAHEGDSAGAHGWVGKNDERVWYWSGDALVEVSGRTGECRSLVDRDPDSGANLMFRAVVPWVLDTPSRTQVPALIQSAADARPYHAVVDLDRDRYRSLREFEPSDATDVQVLGVGSDPDANEGYLLVSYRSGGAVRAEALFVDVDGRVTDRVPVPGAESLDEGAVAGYLQGQAGVVAGVLRDGRSIVFARSGAQLRAADGMDPVGVHRRDGALWLVGTANGEPVVAALDGAGRQQPPVLWSASLAASESLAGDVVVLDDRADPMHRVDWQAPRSAVGPFPFVHPHSPDHYAIDTTGWLVGGPSHDAGGDTETAVAFGPIGISYP